MLAVVLVSGGFLLLLLLLLSTDRVVYAKLIACNRFTVSVAHPIEHPMTLMHSYEPLSFFGSPRTQVSKFAHLLNFTDLKRMRA